MKTKPLRLATFDRFDIVEAWFVWLQSHHCGVVPGTMEDRRGKRHKDYWQSYNRLSWMENDLGYRPRANLSEETLSENERDIYDDLCRRCGFCDCLKEAKGETA